MAEINGTTLTHKRSKMNEELLEDENLDDVFGSDDYIDQGFGPDDYAETMGLYDEEDGWSNDDGCFLGHDCFD